MPCTVGAFSLTSQRIAGAKFPVHPISTPPATNGVAHATRNGIHAVFPTNTDTSEQQQSPKTAAGGGSELTTTTSSPPLQTLRQQECFPISPSVTTAEGGLSDASSLRCNNSHPSFNNNSPITATMIVDDTTPMTTVLDDGGLTPSTISPNVSCVVYRHNPYNVTVFDAKYRTEPMPLESDNDVITPPKSNNNTSDDRYAKQFTPPMPRSQQQCHSSIFSTDDQEPQPSKRRQVSRSGCHAHPIPHQRITPRSQFGVAVPLAAVPTCAFPAPKWACIVAHKCRRAIYSTHLLYKDGDYVLVDGDQGVDMGVVAVVMDMHQCTDFTRLCGRILRLSTHEETAAYHGLLHFENSILTFLRLLKGPEEADTAHNLDLDLSSIHFLDVETQYDQGKIYVYFQSAKHVSIKSLAAMMYNIHKCRIWLHHVDRPSSPPYDKKRFLTSKPERQSQDTSLCSADCESVYERNTGGKWHTK